MYTFERWVTIVACFVWGRVTIPRCFPPRVNVLHCITTIVENSGINHTRIRAPFVAKWWLGGNRWYVLLLRLRYKKSQRKHLLSKWPMCSVNQCVRLQLHRRWNGLCRLKNMWLLNRFLRCHNVQWSLLFLHNNPLNFKKSSKYGQPFHVWYWPSLGDIWLFIIFHRKVVLFYAKGTNISSTRLRGYSTTLLVRSQVLYDTRTRSSSTTRPRPYSICSPSNENIELWRL